MIDTERAIYKNVLKSNSPEHLVGSFECIVGNARGSVTMSYSTDGIYLMHNILLGSVITSLTHCLYSLTGVIIEYDGDLTVGSNAGIWCRSDTQTERIEWLMSDGRIIIGEAEQELQLSFNPVNDSIHGNVYICNVMRMIGNNITRNVTITTKGNHTLL